LTFGFTVTFTLAVDAPYDAVIVAGVVVSTGNAPHAKIPLVDPAETITLGGKLIAGLLADRVTRTCPAGAADVRLTNPTPPCPPVTWLTFTVIEASAADDPLIVSGARSTVLS
jgi:hypothetical protein